MNILDYKTFEQFANLDLPVIEQSSDCTCYRYDRNKLYIFNDDSIFIQTLNHLDLVTSLSKRLELDLPVILDSGQKNGLHFLLVSIVDDSKKDSVDDFDTKLLAATLANFFKRLKSLDFPVWIFSDRDQIDFSTKIGPLKEIIAAQPCSNDQKVYTDILNQGEESSDPINHAFVYGLVSCDDLVIKDGYLIGIDAIATPYYGDEAFNYALGYSCLDKDGRNLFFKALGLDEGTKKRARNWALYQALNASSSDDPAALKTLYHIFEEYYS